jgi:hypothetical protein
LPITRVSGASKMHDAGDPTTSLDTTGSSEYTSTPAKGPSVAAARNASFTSSTVTTRLEAVGAEKFRRLRSAHPGAREDDRADRGRVAAGRGNAATSSTKDRVQHAQVIGAGAGPALPGRNSAGSASPVASAKHYSVWNPKSLL